MLDKSIEVAMKLHPIFALKLMQTKNEIMNLPGFPARLDARITDGIRGDAAQDEKFARGLSNAPAGMSSHKYGLGGHISYMDKQTGVFDWTDFDLFRKAQGVGFRNGLKTGIVFKNKLGQQVQDWLHYELAIAPITIVMEKWRVLEGDWLKFNQWVTGQYLCSL